MKSVLKLVLSAFGLLAILGALMIVGGSIVYVVKEFDFTGGWSILVFLLILAFTFPIWIFVFVAAIDFLSTMGTSSAVQKQLPATDVSVPIAPTQQSEVQKSTNPQFRSLQRIGIYALVAILMVFAYLSVDINKDRPTSILPNVDPASISGEGIKITQYELLKTRRGYIFKVPELSISLLIPEEELDESQLQMQAMRYENGSSLELKLKSGNDVIVTTGDVVSYPGIKFFDEQELVPHEYDSYKELVEKNGSVRVEGYELNGEVHTFWLQRTTQGGVQKHIVVRKSPKFQFSFNPSSFFTNSHDAFFSYAERIIEGADLSQVRIPDQEDLSSASFPSLGLAFEYPREWGSVRFETKSIPGESIQEVYKIDRSQTYYLTEFFFSELDSVSPMILTHSSLANGPLTRDILRYSSFIDFGCESQEVNCVLTRNKHDVMYSNTVLHNQGDYATFFAQGDFGQYDTLIIFRSAIYDLYYNHPTLKISNNAERDERVIQSLTQVLESVREIQIEVKNNSSSTSAY